MKNILVNTEKTRPLVHHITNYVTVNDCANITLAAKGAPLMADDIDEVEDIVGISSALYINIGTLNRRTLASMVKAGEKANQKGIPVVLDPVGVGASQLRNEACKTLMEKVKFTAIKGNLSEIRALYYQTANAGGVDVQDQDKMVNQDLSALELELKQIAKSFKAILAVTGEKDMVVSGQQVFINHTGDAMMGLITGTGCMLGSVLTTYIAANPQEPYLAACATVKAVGMAGERAAKKVRDLGEGNGSFKRYFLDGVSLLLPEDLEG